MSFYHELCVHVQELVGSKLGDSPGFMDQDMRGGEAWRPELMDAVTRAPVFVALLSRGYFRSEWCGKEWDAFSRRCPRRVAEGGGNHATTILPVVWSLRPTVPVPAVVQAVQRFAPDNMEDAKLRGAYEKEGVYGLSIVDPPRYRIVVWHLACLIADLLEAFDVPPLTPPSWGQLRNAFRRKSG